MCILIPVSPSRASMCHNPFSAQVHTDPCLSQPCLHMPQPLHVPTHTLIPVSPSRVSTCHNPFTCPGPHHSPSEAAVATRVTARQPQGPWGDPASSARGRSITGSLYLADWSIIEQSLLGRLENCGKFSGW
ncbi:unnamed protein product [Lepidochelys olivacea]